MNKKYLKLAFLEANKDAKKYMNEYLKLIVEVLGFFMVVIFLLFIWIIT